MITQENLDNWFTHHPPLTEEAIERYKKIREAGKAFARVIVDETPASPDQTVAVRTVREAVMIANAAIACGGK